MKNKGLKYILSLMIFSVLLMVGCGGGGTQKVLTQESPEAAVMRITESWRNSSNSPNIIVDSNGNFVRYLRGGDDSSQDSSQSYKVITLTDLSGKDSIDLYIEKIEKEDNKAKVTCRFYYDSLSFSESSEKDQDSPTTKNLRAGSDAPSSSSDSLIIVFYLVFEEGKWWLDDVDVKSNADTETDTRTDTSTSTSTGTDTDTSSSSDTDTGSSSDTDTGSDTDTYTISGEVNDSDGQHIKGATIWFYIVDDSTGKVSPCNDEKGQQIKVVTDQEGKYDTSKIEGFVFKKGTYLLVVYINGYESQTIKVTLPQETTSENSSSSIRANIIIK